MSTDPDRYLAELDEDRAERRSWRRSEPNGPTNSPGRARPAGATQRPNPGRWRPTAAERELGLRRLAEIREEMAARRADPTWSDR